MLAGALTPCCPDTEVQQTLPPALDQGQPLPFTSHMLCSLTTPVSFSLSAGHL